MILFVDCRVSTNKNEKNYSSSKKNYSYCFYTSCSFALFLISSFIFINIIVFIFFGWYDEEFFIAESFVLNATTIFERDLFDRCIYIRAYRMKSISKRDDDSLFRSWIDFVTFELRTRYYILYNSTTKKKQIYYIYCQCR